MNVTILRKLLKCTRQTQRNRLDNLNHALQYPMIQIQLTISRIPVDNSFWSEISEYIYKTNTPLLPIIHMADGWGVMVSCLVLIS